MVELKDMCSSPMGGPKSQLLNNHQQEDSGTQQKRYPTSKNKGEGRRSAITIKSNPIPTRRVTYKLENNYTTDVLPLLWKFWAQSGFPAWASSKGDSMQGPVGLQGTKPFCVPHFFQHSFSLHNLPWVPMGRFNQLLEKGEEVRPGRSSQEQPWGKVLFSHQQIHTTISLSYFVDTVLPSTWEKLTVNGDRLPISM